MPKRKLNTLFQKTEPTQEELDNVYDVVGETLAPKPVPVDDPGTAAPSPKKRQKPQSIYLSEAELAYIQEIADAYGETRHAVMQYAVKELIRQWKAGKKPRTNILGKLDK